MGRGVELEPDDPREAPLAQLLLDVLEEILGVLVVAIDVRVAGDAEGHDLQDLHAREEVVEVVLDDLPHRDEAARAGDLIDAGRQLGHLDPCEELLALAGAAQHDAERHAEVRDEREAMARIDRERREDREDVAAVPRLGLHLLLVRELLPGEDRDARLGERRQDHLAIDRRLQLDVLQHHGADLREQILRRHRLPRHAADARVDLAAEAADPLHEELVEVAREDREEPHPLEQRRPRIDRFVQHPAIEVEPLKIAAQEARAVAGGDRFAGVRRLGGGEMLGRLHRTGSGWFGR